MCSVRGNFDRNQPCENGAVKMANGTQIRVVRVGIVRICMFDGVVTTVTGIKHVPDLKRNLISLGTLDARGYQYTSQGEALMVSNGAMVVLRGEMSSGLYRLIGNVHTGGTAGRASTNDSSRRKVTRRKRVTFASPIE